MLAGATFQSMITFLPDNSGLLNKQAVAFMAYPVTLASRCYMQLLILKPPEVMPQPTA